MYTYTATLFSDLSEPTNGTSVVSELKDRSYDFKSLNFIKQQYILTTAAVMTDDMVNNFSSQSLNVKALYVARAIQFLDSTLMGFDDSTISVFDAYGRWLYCTKLIFSENSFDNDDIEYDIFFPKISRSCYISPKDYNTISIKIRYRNNDDSIRDDEKYSAYKNWFVNGLGFVEENV